MSCTLLFKKRVQHPEELIHQRWISFRMLPNFRNFIHKSGTKYKLEYDPAILVDSVDAAYLLAKLGAGLTTPPSFLVEQDLQQGTLVEVLPDWHLPSLDTYVVWHPNASETALSIRFKDFLIKQRQRFI